MEKKQSDEDKIKTFFIECFNNILRAEEKKLNQISENKISVSEFHIIEAIATCGKENSSKNIAKQIGITPGSLTVAVNTLENKGYIIKQKDELDKRIIRLNLTKLGEEVNSQHDKFHENMVKGIVKICNKRELFVLTKSLEKINNYFMESKNGF